MSSVSSKVMCTYLQAVQKPHYLLDLLVEHEAVVHPAAVMFHLIVRVIVVGALCLQLQMNPTL